MYEVHQNDMARIGFLCRAASVAYICRRRRRDDRARVASPTFLIPQLVPITVGQHERSRTHIYIITIINMHLPIGPRVVYPSAVVASPAFHSSNPEEEFPGWDFRSATCLQYPATWVANQNLRGCKAWKIISACYSNSTNLRIRLQWF